MNLSPSLVVSRRWMSAALLCAGVVVMLCQPAAGEVTVGRDGDKVVIDNGQIALTVNLAEGSWGASTPAGGSFASGLYCDVRASGQTAATNATRTRRAFASRRIADTFGQGVEATIDCDGDLPFTVAITVYDTGSFFLLQMRIPNGGDLRVSEMRVPAGRLHMGQHIEDVACLVNYWSGSWYTEIQPIDQNEANADWDTYSHFFAALHNRAQPGQNVVMGAVYSDAATMVRLSARKGKTPDGAIDFQMTGAYQDNPLRVAGERYVSQPFFVGAFANALAGLETYGAVVLAHRPTPIWPEVPAGWCSWDAGVSSDPKGILENVAAAARHRLPEYGFKYFQLDDGWQIGSRCSGNWDPKPEFVRAGGMKFLADEIRKAGMVPGLWIGPFGEDGRQTDKPFFAGPRGGAYDLSSPRFKTWLEGEMKRFTDEWGFDYIKADFLSYGGSASRTEPSNRVYRDAVALMKKSMGSPHRYLMTCINREWLSVGFADGQRLGNDVRGGRLDGAYVSVINWGRRYFTNRTFWIGDPDMMHVNLPTLEQSRVWASFVALSGGAVMSGDNLARLKDDRIDLIKKALPPAGITARPIDLFRRPVGYSRKFPRIWDCRVERPWGDWRVVGLFNWTVDIREGREGRRVSQGVSRNVRVDFAGDLGLPAGRRYLVYDFWEGKYLGALAKEVVVGLPAASCKVLAIHPEQDRPIVLGNDRHIVTGAVTLKDVAWNVGALTLSGEVATVSRTDHRLAIHIPPGYVIASAVANGKSATVEADGKFAAGVRFNIGETGKVAWSIRFQRSGARDMGDEPTADSAVGLLEPPAVNKSGSEILLRDVLPEWTDQVHDVEGGPIAGAGADLGTIAPFWVCHDVSSLTDTHTLFQATGRNQSGRESGQVSFEVIGDGKTLFASGVLRNPGDKVEIQANVAGVKELRLICHYAGGWFSSARGTLVRPRLSKP